MVKEKNDLFNYISILAKWKRLIILNTVIISLIAAGVSLILPKWYTARTTILPPTEESGNLGLSGMLDKFPFSGFGLTTVSDETYLFLAILNSRTVMESVAVKFDLMRRFKKEDMEETLRTLRKCVTVKVNEEGTITLFAEAGTPYFADAQKEKEARELARDVANFFIEELDKVNTVLKIEKARNTRIFIEKRYLQNIGDLHTAEEEFKKFQQEYGAVALPEQTEAAMKAAAGLKAAIISKEVELGIISKYANVEHISYKKAKTALNALKNSYEQFLNGTNTNVGSKKSMELQNKDIFVPFENVPEIGLQYARLLREVTLQETLLEFLLPQYEQAKIQEAKDTPTVQVLDEANVPIKRSSPKRKIIVILCMIGSLFVSGIMVFVLENWHYFKQQLSIARNDD